MINVLVLSGTNHGFDQSAPIITKILSQSPGTQVTLTDDKSILSSPDLARFSAIVPGIGFTRRQRQPDGVVATTRELAPADESGLLSYVRDGGGFVGVHGTGWWIGGEAVRLVGGHANWHPAGLEFKVNIEQPGHPCVAGLSDFLVTDEIYMSAWDPAIDLLATASWAERKHPVAWTHSYGYGKVFYTTLGHGPSTFENAAVQRLLENGALWVARRD
jgi:type 1 glutamine amidotransferase